ncbi:MAG TPA: hypothetical protein VK425_01030 [Acidimicrobiales bacterium]|nr:hypothetical protein [Acidimicrobiales bacterium]
MHEHGRGVVVEVRVLRGADVEPRARRVVKVVEVRALVRQRATPHLARAVEVGTPRVLGVGPNRGGAVHPA